MDFMKLKASLSLDSGDYESGLNNAESKAKGFGGKFKTAMAVGGAAVAAATTAVAALVKKSVDSYAEYQQMVGGVKKLYGNMGMPIEEYAKSVGKSVDEVKGDYNKLEQAQNLVLENAKNAYKTTGMSMNDYMSTATSFSASLINSLGGDTVKAAEQTDVAMRAISDNFNTFGGDIGMIQGAFQGFAKQNYTMLDNLKLGYGGTKSEMERLIADANEWGAANGKASDLSIDSFSDVVTAIDYIQQKQQIAGTTAREAGTTIEGSFMAVKAAWENLMTGIADPDADISVLMQQLVESVGVAASNLGPAVLQAIEGVGEAFNTILPELLSNLPTIIETYGVPLIQTGANLVANLISGLTQAAPGLISMAFKLVGDLLMGIATSLPNAIVMGINLITSIIEGFTQGSGDLVSRMGEILVALGTAIVDALPALGAAMLNLAKALGNFFLKTNWVSVGLKAFRSVLSGIRSVLPGIISAVSSAVRSVVASLGFSGAAAKARAAFESIKKGISDKIDAAKQKVKDVIETIKGYFPFSVGKIFSGWIPKIKLWTSKSGDSAETQSSTSSVHFAKAMNRPYLFRKETLVNQYAGHAWGGGEIMYGKNNLMSDIREAAGGGNGGITINLNYMAGDDANDMVRDMARIIERYRMAGAM